MLPISFLPPPAQPPHFLFPFSLLTTEGVSLTWESYLPHGPREAPRWLRQGAGGSAPEGARERPGSQPPFAGLLPPPPAPGHPPPAPPPSASPIPARRPRPPPPRTPRVWVGTAGAEPEALSQFPGNLFSQTLAANQSWFRSLPRGTKTVIFFVIKVRKELGTNTAGDLFFAFCSAGRGPAGVCPQRPARSGRPAALVDSTPRCLHPDPAAAAPGREPQGGAGGWGAVFTPPQAPVPAAGA